MFNQDVEKLELSHIIGRNVKWSGHLENSLVVSQSIYKVTIYTAIWLLVIHTKEIKTHSHRSMNISVHSSIIP